MNPPEPHRPGAPLPAPDPASDGTPPCGLRICEVGLAERPVVAALNQRIFQEDRIINSFDRADLLILLALLDDVPVGFKIGYRENRYTFYSAKGGVLPGHRRQGIARALLHDMMARVRARGYVRFAYDTFPNMHPGMTILGLREGFRLMKADYNPVYRDYRLRFEKKL